MVKETPRKDSIEKFGKGIWGEKKSLRYDGKLERETEKENEKVNEQEWENNSTWTEGSIAQVPKMEINWNWQAPIFLLKTLPSSHVMFYKFTGWNYVKPGMCQGIT